jgi:hypothetical protein
MPFVSSCGVDPDCGVEEPVFIAEMFFLPTRRVK